MDSMDVMSDFMVENLTRHNVAKHRDTVPPIDSRFDNIVHVEPDCGRGGLGCVLVGAQTFGYPDFAAPTPHSLFAFLTGQSGLIREDNRLQADDILRWDISQKRFDSLFKVRWRLKIAV